MACEEIPIWRFCLASSSICQVGQFKYLPSGLLSTRHQVLFDVRCVGLPTRMAFRARCRDDVSRVLGEVLDRNALDSIAPHQAHRVGQELYLGLDADPAPGSSFSINDCKTLERQSGEWQSVGKSGWDGELTGRIFAVRMLRQQNATPFRRPTVGGFGCLNV